MKYNKVIAGIVFLIGSHFTAASADSHIESHSDGTPSAQDVDGSLGAEYKKLLRMMQEKRKPVQTIDGALGIAGVTGYPP